MTEPIKISTSKYTKSGKVNIDGNIWEVTLPGAGTELRFSQATRALKLFGSRIDLLDKKIEKGTITESELDKYEEYSKKFEQNERVIYDLFRGIFKDTTKDNSEVNKWLDETPTAIITLAFEDIKASANQEDSNGRKESTESS